MQLLDTVRGRVTGNGFELFREIPFPFFCDWRGKIGWKIGLAKSETALKSYKSFPGTESGIRDFWEMIALLERKKYCPVCGELAAVLDGDPDKYGDKAVPWNTFIRVKYDCDECRAIMSGQQKRVSNRRRKKERKQEREAIFDVLNAYREEVRLSRQRIAELERAARAH